MEGSQTVLWSLHGKNCMDSILVNVEQDAQDTDHTTHLQRISSGKSSGRDNLANLVLKSYADLLSEPVAVILRITVTNGVEISKHMPNSPQKQDCIGG